MRKFILAAAGAAILGLASWATPSTAMPAGQVVSPDPVAQTVQFRPVRVHRRPRCWTERRFVGRDRWGRPRFRHVRICR